MNKDYSIFKFPKLVLTGIVFTILISGLLGYDFAYATHETNENQVSNVEEENETTQEVEAVKENTTVDTKSILSDEVSQNEESTDGSTGCTTQEFGGRISGYPVQNLDLFGFKPVQQIIGFGGMLSSQTNEDDCLKTLEVIEVLEAEPEISVELYMRTNGEVVNFVEVFEDMEVIRETGYPPFSITGSVTLSEPILHPSTYVMYGLNSKSYVTDKFEVVLDVNLEESKFKNIVYNNCYLTKSHISPTDANDSNMMMNDYQHSYYVDSFEFSCKGFTSSEFS